MVNKKVTVAQQLARTVCALQNCRKEPERFSVWLEKHEDRVKGIEGRYLPHGSGFDAGTKVDVESCTNTKLVFSTSFHHMNEVGMYDGWTEHEVVVRPTFDSLDIIVKGRNKNDIKDYISEVLYNCLQEEYNEE